MTIVCRAAWLLIGCGAAALGCSTSVRVLDRPDTSIDGASTIDAADAGSDAGATDAGSDVGAVDAGSDAGPADAGSDGAVDAGSLVVDPSAITVPAGRDQIFVATPRATGWSVTEPGGGTIDATGMYVAPSTPGVYHVVATDGVRRGTATVNVVRMDLGIVAGGLGGAGNLDAAGTDARFSFSRAIAYDGAGTLFVADQDGLLIRRVEVATGITTTLAGGGDPRGPSADGVGNAAYFGGPTLLAYRAASHTLFVGDSQTVRTVDTTTGRVTTVAGRRGATGSADGVGAAASFGSFGGLCLIGDTLYVADTNNQTIRTMNTSTFEVRLLAGGTGSRGHVDSADPLAARFDNPAGLTCGASTVYVGDVGGDAIRTIDQSGGPTDGAVATLVQDARPVTVWDGDFGVAQVGGPMFLAVDEARSRIYFSVWEVGNVRVADLTRRTLTTFVGGDEYGYADGVGSAARFVQPTGLVSDGTTLWTADHSDSRIRAIDIATSMVTSLAGQGSWRAAGTTDGTLATARLYAPCALASGSAGEVLVGEDSFDVRALSIAANSVTLRAGIPQVPGRANGTLGFARMSRPTGLGVDPGGMLWLADEDTTLRRVDAVGTIDTVFGASMTTGTTDAMGTAARFGLVRGVAFAGGRIYVTDESHTIRALDPSTGAVTTLCGLPGVTGSDDGVGSAARFNTMLDIASDGIGTLWVSDSFNHTVREIDIASGRVSTLAGSPLTSGAADGIGTTATFMVPYGIAYDGAGSLYVSDRGAGEVRRIWLSTGAVSTIAGQPSAQGVVLGDVATATLNTPRDLIVMPSGEIWITSEQAVLRIAPAP